MTYNSEDSFQPLRGDRRGQRGRVSRLPTGGFPSQLRGRIARECPRCGAGPGKKCRRWLPAGGYYRINEKFHPERSAKAGPS